MDKLDHSHPISHAGTVGEFWQWAYSDILGNTNRGVFAEYLVGQALGEDVLDKPRLGWNCYDLLYRGFRLEIKASGYVQRWHKPGDKRSSPRFGIGKSTGWKAEEGEYTDGPGRNCDCYVFCLYRGDKDQVLDVAQWDFYVIPTQKLESILSANGSEEKKEVGIGWVREHCCKAESYHTLRACIDETLKEVEP